MTSKRRMINIVRNRISSTGLCSFLQKFFTVDVLTIYEVLMLPKGQEIKADSYSVAAHIIDAVS